MDNFNGFSQPQENWSKLPHALIDSLQLIETIGELKVILYILRHTWGYRDSEKLITLDEFMNGRKKRDGSTIDNGTGLSKPTIIDGLRRAIDHGFIAVETNDRDTARIKKTYRLVSKDFTPEVKKLYPRGKETLHRTEKDTLDTNLKKENNNNRDDFRAAVIAYENEIHPSLTPLIADNIGAAVDEWGGDTVVEAIGIAAASGVRNWRYIEGVLNNWRVNGRNQKGKKDKERKAAEVPDRMQVPDGKGGKLIYLNGKLDLQATEEYNNGHNKQPAN